MKQCTSAVKLSDKETERCNEAMYFSVKILRKRPNVVMKQCTSAVKLSDKEIERCNEAMYFSSKDFKEN